MPVFGVFADDNKPAVSRRHDRGRNRFSTATAAGQEAGYKAVNARTSWDAGVDLRLRHGYELCSRRPASSTS